MTATRTATATDTKTTTSPSTYGKTFGKVARALPGSSPVQSDMGVNMFSEDTRQHVLGLLEEGYPFV